MGQRDAHAVGMLWAVLASVGIASCGGCDSGANGGGAGAEAGGQWQLDGAGESREAGKESAAGAASGGRASLPDGVGAGAEAGQGDELGVRGGSGGSGGSPDHTSCATERASWWSGETNSCHACPANAMVECDEIVAGASYDAESSTLALQLPPGRLEVATASLGVTFNYEDGTEHYADVKGVIRGDTLTFHFSPWRRSGIAFLSGEPTIMDSCGDYLYVHAPGFGFGPAIMVEVDPISGQGGAANYPDIRCGKTN